MATQQIVPQSRTSTSGESDYGPFVASKKRQIFHRPDCEWAQSLTPEKSFEFGTHREATDAGYKPCKTCRA